MSWLRRLFRPTIEIVIVIDCCPKPAKKIVVDSITINNLKTKGIIMETTLKSTEKIDYTLLWVDEDGNETPSAVTGVSASNGDGSVAVAQPTADHTGFIVAKGQGKVDIVFSGQNADGETIQGVLTVTVDDVTGGGGGTTAKVAKSIGIRLGTAVPQ